MKRNFTPLIMLALALMALNYGTVTQAQDTKRFGFISTNVQNPAEASMLEGFRMVAENSGAEIIVINAQGSVEKMTNGVLDLITQAVDGIATITMDGVAAESWVDQANEANIPYVSVAVQVGDPEKRAFRDVYPGLTAFVGQDYVLSGRRIAEAAIERGFLPADRTAKIGVVEGQPGYALVDQLKEGFGAALDDSGLKYEIVMSQPTDWTPAKGQEVCANALIANPDIDLIFSHAEDMAIGCARAIKDAGAKTKLISIAGGSNLGFPLIKSGDIALSMCEAWVDTGALSAQAMLDAISEEGSEPKAQLVEYKPVIIHAGNIDSTCNPPQW